MAKPKLPKGMYELHVKGRKTPLIVQLQAIPIGHVVQLDLFKPEKRTIPEAGHARFIVTCDRFMVYTCIGADNQHHASNKATKLFGPHWSKIFEDKPNRMFILEHTFAAYKEFKRLIKTLQY